MRRSGRRSVSPWRRCRCIIRSAWRNRLALIDNISKGRLIVGLGRGTAYNIYDYQGYGLDHTEAQARFEEAEAIMFQAWRGEKFEHHGRFWDIKVPMLRPLPYTSRIPT